ncbi:DUF4150 domain-containing protein [Pseudenhygromyxa sp. WMMC2535]|uniref:DUF4150 domain-containing protein n=1 Tax=Pseudenhygromyxa sp. WMMC2535 TaxID=2712867 RepID=UPI0015572D92|nr:DUF4150 domain-containing protein [Pseudenhygromyxa sp. WMMC2535]NVB38660.1 DUF4150 domain-containing protein [Pseudenhygromyxa sp. WMMC2535]
MSNSKVYANGRSIVHAGDGQTNTSAPPDVCKTPSPGGPVPVPYVNVAKSRDLEAGTKRTKIGGSSVAIQGATLSTSTGDEAGSAGGGLLSSKTKGKLSWATRSPNVKFEGKGVVRFMDTTLHNGNTFNTSFIQQGGTGLAYGDDFEGPCPLCGKSADKHRIKEMKASSAAIAADIVKRLHANPRRYAKTVKSKHGDKLKGYMVGVLVCNCKTWATTSGMTQEHFHEAAEGCVTIGGGGVDSSTLAGENDRAYGLIMSTVDHINKIRKSNSKELIELRNQTSKPGTCAAQKLLARAKGHEILSMTEIMWRPEGKWTQRYSLNLAKPTNTRKRTFTFSDYTPDDAARRITSKAVGSCYSCQLILPLLLCDLGDWKC